MKKLFGKPDAVWLASTLIGCALLASAIFLPLWRMELVAPQYPSGLVMYAYGDRFEGGTEGYYKGFDSVKEINSLNHYIGMKPIQPVTEMDLFVPGLLATMVGALVASFVAWHRRWFRALVIAGFWFIPVFFVVDLQYWLYDYGHSMDPHAALNTGDITPKVWGTTEVWNFHSKNGFEPGFYMMILAAMTISFLPPAVHAIQRRRGRRQVVTRATNVSSTPVGTKAA
jgi:hypothetical protein